MQVLTNFARGEDTESMSELSEEKARERAKGLMRPDIVRNKGEYCRDIGQQNKQEPKAIS